VNKLLFDEAVQFVRAANGYTNSISHGKNGNKTQNAAVPDGDRIQTIGILNEKSVHAVLKRYFEPNADSHEIKVGGYVADIVGENGIIEIQTGSFDKLKRKLTAFLAVTRVTVVYPIIVKKRVVNIDTGKSYTSPKKGTIYSFLSEASKLGDLVKHENLSFCLCLISADELRTGTGRKAAKLDRIPTGQTDEIPLDNMSDWHIFTDNLPETFTMKDFEAASKLRGLEAWTALKALCNASVVTQNGKRGNAYLYEKS
jgi:hypothetical protein